jgi:ABC-type nitrate/sulfonate/bicarbonate transport system substrate-binding protein
MRGLRSLPLLSTVAVVSLALAVGACGGDDSAGGGGSGAKKFDTAVLASVNNMMHVPEFVGVEKGFFAERGLDVKLKILQSGSDINKALQSGDAEFGGASNTAIAPARVAGIKSRLIAPAMNDATTATYAGPLGIVGRKDRGIRADDPQSLKGKRVALLEGSTTQAYLRLFLEKSGMKESDVKAVPLEVADHPVSLKQGDVDAAASWEPYVSQEIRELGSNSAIVSRGAPVLGYTIGVGATESVINAKPKVLQKFAEGIAKSNSYIRKNPEEAAKAATSFIKGLNEQDARTALDGHLKFDPRMSKCTQQLFADSTADLKRLGEIDTAPPAKDMIYPAVMQKVEKEHPEWFSDLPPIPKRCRF